MNKKEKLELILKYIAEHNFTAYEIGKHTKISTLAVQNIINGKTKNPTDATLNILLDFIENSIVGSNYKPNTKIENLKENTIPYNTNQELISTQKQLISTQESFIRTQEELIKTQRDLIQAHKDQVTDKTQFIESLKNELNDMKSSKPKNARHP